MKAIKVEILGKTYPLRVEADEVESMQRIAKFVDQRFKEYKKELSKQPDSTVMALASLSIAEELFEEHQRKSAAEGVEEETFQRVNRSLKELLQEIS